MIELAKLGYYFEMECALLKDRQSRETLGNIRNVSGVSVKRQRDLRQLSAKYRAARYS